MNLIFSLCFTQDSLILLYVHTWYWYPFTIHIINRKALGLTDFISRRRSSDWIWGVGSTIMSIIFRQLSGTFVWMDLLTVQWMRFLLRWFSWIWGVRYVQTRPHYVIFVRIHVLPVVFICAVICSPVHSSQSYLFCFTSAALLWPSHQQAARQFRDPWIQQRDIQSSLASSAEETAWTVCFFGLLASPSAAAAWPSHHNHLIERSLDGAHFWRQRCALIVRYVPASYSPMFASRLLFSSPLLLVAPPLLHAQSSPHLMSI